MTPALGIRAPSRAQAAPDRLAGDEESRLRALAADIGIAFLPLDATPRADCPHDDRSFVAAAATGLLPLRGDDGAPVLVIAPRGPAIGRLIEFARRDPAAAARVRITTTDRFNRFLLRAGPALVEAATGDLAARRPMQSARWGLRRRCGFVLAAAIVPVAAAMVAAPAAATMATGVLLSSVFGAWLALRLAGAIIGGRAPPPPRPLPDSALPVYTIIAALYREAASVAGLLAAIGRLDYPPEKLDVVVAVEADDGDTRAALDTAKPKFPITVLPVPPQGPRTKPKALNVALPFARGTYTVIYDAEDRPDPGQLRVALQAFLAGPANLACVQARLCVDNTEDGWLSGYFTAEYAGQFDVFMPGLATMGLPLPLGGSSNHFHTKTLREAGAWDPFNVTEDADLGMRLARLGYRTGMIDSTTYEEAPARLKPWLRQRSRWFKGWMQTWLVHTRKPATLLRQLGPAGFAGFHLVVGGNVLAALMHPLFAAALIASTLFGASGVDHLAITLYAATAALGYLTSVAIGWVGLSRRGLRASAWVLALTPLHWLLLSLAAWRALYQLFAAPFAWEKTEHGLARASHRAARVAQALAGLDRDLGAAKRDGRLPTINGATGTSADRRPPLAASA